MTRVDFYILADTAPASRDRFACRLAEKAWAQGHRVYLHVEDAAAAERLDELLWTFRDGSFVPHARMDQDPDPDAAVHIGHGDAPGDHQDVLINLDGTVPLFFSRFRRVAEVVGGDETERQTARERYRFYRDRGYDLESHAIEER